MERNYDVAVALVSCATPFLNTINTLRVNSVQAELVKKHLSEKAQNNFLMIVDDKKGYFFSIGTICEQFCKYVLNQNVHPTLFSSKLWCTCFDVFNLTDLYHKIKVAIISKKLKICYNSVSPVRCYNEISRVSEFLQEDFAQIAAENSRIGYIWYQIIANTNMVIKLLQEAKFKPQDCSKKVLVKFIKNELSNLNYTSYCGIEKFETDISYRKLFIPKLLYILEEME